MTVEEELQECLNVVDRNLRKAIVFSNENFRLFWNIAVIIRTDTDYLIPYQLWLQSFLIEVRENVKYIRRIRKNIADLIDARNEYKRSQRDIEVVNQQEVQGERVNNTGEEIGDRAD